MSLPLHQVTDLHMKDPAVLQALQDRNIPRGNMNECQLTAVKMALNDERPLVCIQGAPGTGKTHTLALLIFRLLKLKKKVLVVGATRGPLMVLKEMVENLVEKRTKEVKDWNANTLTDFTNHDFLDDVSQEQQESFRVVFVKFEASFLEELAEKFDPCMCIIDEAAQVPKTQPFPKVIQSKKIVLAGDPWSLHSEFWMERSRHPAESILDYVLGKKDHASYVILTEQFRCLKEIADWSNGCFYNCQLQNSCSQDELVASLHPRPDNFFQKLYAPLVHIDTSLVTGVPDRWETYEQWSKSTEWDVPGVKNSFFNRGEANYALLHYRSLIQRSIKPESIAILTPFGAQISLLKAMMTNLCKEGKKFEECNRTVIGTVDDVQGREFDAVIFCTVRSNPQKTLGWHFRQLNRLNVVLTRARRHFMLISNGYMLANSDEPKIRLLFDYTRRSSRLDPEMLRGLCGAPVPSNVLNNFGHLYEDFITHTNNPLIHEWCRESMRHYREERAETAATSETSTTVSLSLPLHQLINFHMTDPAVLQGLQDNEDVAITFASDIQMIAIRMAMNDERPLVCIQGAAGSGKTHTLASFIFRIIRSHRRKALVVGATKAALAGLKKMVEMMVAMKSSACPYWNSYTLMDFTDETNLDHFSQYKQKHLRVAFVTFDATFLEELTEKYCPSICIIDDAAHVAKNQLLPESLKSMRIVMAGNQWSRHHDERSRRPVESILDHVLSKKAYFSHVQLDEQFCSEHPESSLGIREELLQTKEQVRTLTDELEEKKRELKKLQLEVRNPSVL